ncbi:MAG TPA: hypothetical protein VK503_09840 [Candidatus Bathyarchaeia archaeon]|nr:hypothetical protein [Candidatus Bathyarchaeia archaeon]
MSKALPAEYFLDTINNRAHIGEFTEQISVMLEDFFSKTVGVETATFL